MAQKPRAQNVSRMRKQATRLSQLADIFNVLKRGGNTGQQLQALLEHAAATIAAIRRYADKNDTFESELVDGIDLWIQTDPLIVIKFRKLAAEYGKLANPTKGSRVGNDVARSNVKPPYVHVGIAPK